MTKAKEAQKFVSALIDGYGFQFVLLSLEQVARKRGVLGEHQRLDIRTDDPSAPKAAAAMRRPIHTGGPR